MTTYPSILAWKLQGQRNLVGYSSWSQKVSDMTEQLMHTHTHTHVFFFRFFPHLLQNIE